MHLLARPHFEKFNAYTGLAQGRDPRDALPQNGRGWMGPNCDVGNVAPNFIPQHVHEMSFIVGTFPA